MAAKIISVSADDSTYYGLPGSSGDFSIDQEGITDTIFGQSFNSTESGLTSWTMSGNAMFKGFAGYKATIKKSGSSTSFFAETMNLVSGKTYEIGDSAKNCWDRAGTFVVDDGGSDVTDQVESFDYLFGRITFKSSYTPSGVISVDGAYFGLASYGNAQDFTLTMSADTVDTTDFATAQGNNGYRTFRYGLKNVSLSLSGFFNVTNGFKTLIDSRQEVIVEINPDGQGKSVARGYFKAINTSQSGDVGGDESEDVSFELSVPYTDNGSISPFSWKHASDSTIPSAIKEALNSWAYDGAFYVKYLPDGVNGWKGGVILTDVSLSSGLSAMNDFAVSAQGTGAYTAV